VSEGMLRLLHDKYLDGKLNILEEKDGIIIAKIDHNRKVRISFCKTQFGNFFAEGTIMPL
jgi:hypothetical protein